MVLWCVKTNVRESGVEKEELRRHVQQADGGAAVGWMAWSSPCIAVAPETDIVKTNRCAPVRSAPALQHRHVSITPVTFANTNH